MGKALFFVCVGSIVQPTTSLWRLRIAALRTLVVVTDANGALTVQAIGPEAGELDVSLRHVHVSEQEPEAKDRLG